MNIDIYSPQTLRRLGCKALLLLAVTLHTSSLYSAPLPVIFVIDAALGSAEWTAAAEITLETSSQLPDDTAFSIVIYDDVVQKVVPLGTMGTERLALIKQTLDDAVTMPTSNLAAGIERAQDELKEIPSGHIILLTTAQITTQSTDKRAQFLEWYTNVLLPDAAEKPLTLTFVSQATADTSPLLKAAQSYQNTSLITLQPSSTATETLIALLNKPSLSETDAQANATQVVPDNANVANSTVVIPEPTNMDTEDTNPADSTTPSTSNNPSDITNPSVSSPTAGGTGASSASTGASSADSPNIGAPSTEASSQDTQIAPIVKNTNQQWDRQMLYMLWYGCLALVLLALVGWLIWSIKKRKASTNTTVQSITGQTGSAYLPLNEMPSRRFDALADAIDDIEPYKEWTADPRTVKQVKAEPLAQQQEPNVSADKPSPPRDATIRRVPNVFKPKD